MNSRPPVHPYQRILLAPTCTESLNLLISLENIPNSLGNQKDSGRNHFKAWRRASQPHFAPNKYKKGMKNAKRKRVETQGISEKSLKSVTTLESEDEEIPA